MSGHRYRLGYEVHDFPAEGISVEEARKFAEEKKSCGVTDALMLTSVIYPEDGSLSVLFVSKDGRTGKPMDDLEYFKIWSLLARRLSLSKTLDEGKRALAAEVFGVISQAIHVETQAMDVAKQMFGVEDPTPEQLTAARTALFGTRFGGSTEIPEPESDA